MNYNPAIHHRKSIRLHMYNYSRSGIYFITICTKNRVCHFGNIVDNKVILNNAGQIARQCWLDIPLHFPHAKLDEFIIMPNHIHGIIILNNCITGTNNHSPHRTAPHNNSPINIESVNDPNDSITNNNIPLNRTYGAAPAVGANNYSPLRCNGTSKTIGSIVRGFKIGVTKWFRINFGNIELWQRNYWEHIIRNENETYRISQYIKNNPINWNNDKLNGGTGNSVLEESAPYI